MNKSSVGMAWSSNVAAGVARLLGMDGGDATRQINVHTQASVGTREMYSTFTWRSRLFCSLSRCFLAFQSVKVSQVVTVRVSREPEGGETDIILRKGWLQTDWRQKKVHTVQSSLLRTKLDTLYYLFLCQILPVSKQTAQLYWFIDQRQGPMVSAPGSWRPVQTSSSILAGARRRHRHRS